MVEGLVPLVTGMLEVVGIATTLLGAVTASVIAARQVLARGAALTVYESYRRRLSRGILLGLEFLVAADIIGTVAVEPTFRSVGILGLIVLIRTFLSFTLEVEIAGRWPWDTRVAPASAEQLGKGENRWQFDHWS